MIKAVFFDIDGTLVSFKTHQVPFSTFRSIEALKAKNIKVFIATGRQFEAIDNLGSLEFDGYITLNGSYCLAGTQKVIYKHSITSASIEKLAGYLSKDPFPCVFVREKDMFINYINEKVEEGLRLINFPFPLVGSLDMALDAEIFQLIAFINSRQEKELIKLLPECNALRWTSIFADIVPEGSGKQIGIDKMLDYYRIPLEECMAFGDGGNDISMLRHVGLGIAMGNADDTVRQSADYVTSSVDDDGVKKALEHFGIL